MHEEQEGTWSSSGIASVGTFGVRISSYRGIMIEKTDAWRR
jgi:hypothetical protein